MMKRIRTVHLPEDLLVEILSRVPAKSLARLRSTSKRWNALVNDGILAKKHSSNAPRDSSLVLMVTDFRVHLVSVDLHGNVTPSAKITSQFSIKNSLLEQVDICNAYHCDGLLVCITKDNRLVAWNPCTGETRWIQARKYNETDCYALGYDNKSSCYKILRMCQFEDVINTIYSTESEVYDFASNSWSCIGLTTDWYIPQGRTRGMSVNGTVYWLAFTQVQYTRFLLSFDFSTERFQSILLSVDAPCHLIGVALSVTRGEQQLCMLDTYGSNEVKSDVWIATKMEDTGALSWRKFRCLHLRILMSVLADHENKVLLCCNNPRLYNNTLHIVGDDKYIQWDYNRLKNCTTSLGDSKCPLLLTYVPSLVQIP